MKNADNIKRFIEKASVSSNPNVNKVVFNELAEELEKSKQTGVSPNKWRKIMKSPITKLAVAALIIGLVAVGFTLVEKTTTPAYAIEQTINAMRKINTFHAFGIMNDGSEYECWVQPNQDANGTPNIYLSLPSERIISTPRESYIINKQNDTLKRYKGGYLQARADFSNIVQWLYKETVVPGLCNMTYKQITGKDESRQIQIILTGQIEASFLIDLHTGLLISAEIISGEKGDYVVRTINKIIYNEPLPKGIFELEIPEGAKVIEQ